MAKHFLEIADFTTEELQLLLTESAHLKEIYRRGGRDHSLAGKSAAMLFEKPSSRTRISFQVGMTQLGGSSIYIRPEDIGGLGKREPVSDLTRVLNGYVDVIVARVFSHETLREMAQWSKVPVINALSDLAHPCQAMADILTIREHFATLPGRKLAFIGDGNNVARSLALACVKLGLRFALAAPAGYELPADFVAELKREAGAGQLEFTTDPYQAVKGADVIYTDTWVSMGQEDEKQIRLKAFAGYTLDMKLLKAAGPHAKVMHCLPAYRGLEITEEVMESPQSVIFDEAENRLHFQRALLKHLVMANVEAPVKGTRMKIQQPKNGF